MPPFHSDQFASFSYQSITCMMTISTYQAHIPIVRNHGPSLYSKIHFLLLRVSDLMTWNDHEVNQTGIYQLG